MGFFSNLMGGDQRDDINRATNRARTTVTQGYDEGRNEIRGGLDNALKHLTSTLEGGERAREVYETALGLRGADAQRQYYDEFLDDPGFATETQAGLDALEARNNARGYSLSGRGFAEVAELGQTQRRQAHQDRLTSLADLVGLGGQASSNAAELAYRGGSDLAGLSVGRGGTLANLELGRGQALAKTRGPTLGDIATYIQQNAETAAKAYAGMG
jgi:hypothetical protein